MHGGFDPTQWAQGKGLPGLDVKWYDKGALVKGPSVIGVGERRPEMVGALDDVFPMMVRAFKDALGDMPMQRSQVPIEVRANPRDMLAALYALMVAAEAQRGRGAQGAFAGV